MPRLVPLIAIGLVTLGLGFEFYQVLAPFLLPLFLAAVLALLSEPIHRWFLGRFPGKTALSAGLTTTVVMGLILLPFVLGTFLAVGELARLTRRVASDPEWAERLKTLQAQPWVREGLHYAQESLGWEIPEKGEDDAQIRDTINRRVREIGVWLAQRTMGAAEGTMAMAANLANMGIAGFTLLLAYYYFLADGPNLYQRARGTLPVDPAHFDTLATQFETAVRAVVLATLAAAVGQGIAMAIALWLSGFHGFFLLAILGTISALIPVVGTCLLWCPAVIWLFATGQTTMAVVLALYSLIIVGSLDNVIRAYVLNNSVELHPVLAFVSVLGGLQALGLWGVFIGPVIASCLFAAVQIFNQELDAFSAQTPPSRSQEGTISAAAVAVAQPADGVAVERNLVEQMPTPSTPSTSA